MRFRPLKSFFSDELRSQYVPGLRYTARLEDVKLRELVPVWLKEGMIELVEETKPQTPEAKVSGTGGVS